MKLLITMLEYLPGGKSLQASADAPGFLLERLERESKDYRTFPSCSERRWAMGQTGLGPWLCGVGRESTRSPHWKEANSPLPVLGTFASLVSLLLEVWSPSSAVFFLYLHLDQSEWTDGMTDCCGQNYTPACSTLKS